MSAKISTKKEFVYQEEGILKEKLTITNLEKIAHIFGLLFVHHS